MPLRGLPSLFVHYHLIKNLNLNLHIAAADNAVAMYGREVRYFCGASMAASFRVN